MAKLLDIEGIGPKYAEQLKKAGVGSIEKLLAEGSTPEGRKKIEETTGIDHKLVLEWVNHADLFRIKGVASEYSDLLEEAGVDTVPELAQRSAENLYKKLVEINEAKKLVRHMPTQSQVADWVAQAKKLARIVVY